MGYYATIWILACPGVVVLSVIFFLSSPQGKRPMLPGIQFRNKRKFERITLDQLSIHARPFLRGGDPCTSLTVYCSAPPRQKAAGVLLFKKGTVARLSFLGSALHCSASAPPVVPASACMGRLLPPDCACPAEQTMMCCFFFSLSLSLCLPSWIKRMPSLPLMEGARTGLAWLRGYSKTLNFGQSKPSDISPKQSEITYFRRLKAYCSTVPVPRS